MTIYVFGNKLLEQDSLPLKLLPKLKKRFPQINFVVKDPAENWTSDEKEIIVIDTVVGIDKVTIFNSLDDLEKYNPRITPHDYDVYLDLALMKKIGKVKNVKIIGVPLNRSFKETSHQVKVVLDNL